MKKPDYTVLDESILFEIGQGADNFTDLSIRCNTLAEKYCTNQAVSVTPGWRVVDRRLQALRKAGKIAYTPADGWRLLCA